ncbi:hypothetical protein [Streptomyces barkulensis]|uniref:hypothetical protein n=1 Tax=Streptomyces barkulensis TaxID=1257026 RepID=UPI000C6D4F5A|nr:hypothetical protein [Streptomyces barkulensis]
MSDLLIEHDGTPLSGKIHLDGAKHAFAHSLACAALSDQGVLTSVPDHIDARALRTALSLVFARVTYDTGTRRLSFGEPLQPPQVTVPSELAGRSRSLFCLLPALLARAGEVVMESAPQGCRIGQRPIDWYTRILAQFGVESRADGTATVYTWRRRHAAQVNFEYPTMTGTVIALAAAAVSPGVTTIGNASVEPSCAEQLACLREMGGKVSGGLPDVRIEGRDGYSGTQWAVGPDRIHAVTYLTAGLLTRGKVTVTGARPLDIPRYVEFLDRVDACGDITADSITAGFPDSGFLRPVQIAAGSEPLFSSDWVAFTSLLLAMRGQGPSTLSDDVFLQRFQYVDNLVPHGLDGISLRHAPRGGRSAVHADIRPNSRDTLRAGDFGTCADIRGSATLVLAALAADGPCKVRDDFHIRRGYTDLAGDLATLGVTTVGTIREETAR